MAQAPLERSPDATCFFCQNIKAVSYDRVTQSSIEVSTIFHGECSTCQESTWKDEQLCSFCRHLRLRHVFFCKWNPYAQIDKQKPSRWQNGFALLKIVMGKEIEFPEKCAFCKLIQHSARVNSPRYSKKLSQAEFIDQIEILGRNLVKNFSLPYINLNLIVLDDQLLSSGIIQPLVSGDGIPSSGIGATVQWGEVKHWVDRCSTRHVECDRTYLARPKHIRLIDVRRRRVMSINHNCRFVALSYVWGPNPDPTKTAALRSNIKELERDGGIKATNLPATIEDAIQVCIHLGERYLWVDRLCIIQDDNHHKHQQIGEMAAIFASAHLVIAVPDCTMDDGIPGIRPRHPRMQQSVQIDGIIFMNGVPSVRAVLEDCIWNTRAWTYQEYILARRILYLSHTQAFFDCMGDSYSQTECFLYENYQRFSNKSQSENSWDFINFIKHLREFTSRELSYPSDVYDAFSAIPAAIFKDNQGLFYGLPRQYFDRALLWSCNKPQSLRTSDKVLLPSWSWSSIVGQISMFMSDNEFAGSLVAWKYLEGNHKPCPAFVNIHKDSYIDYDPSSQYFWIRRPRTGGPRLTKISSDRKGLCDIILRPHSLVLPLAIAWSHGCVETEWPMGFLEESTFDEFDADVKGLSGSCQGLEKRSLRGMMPDLPEWLSETEVETKLSPSTLKGRVQICSFGLLDPPRYNIIPHVRVLDDDGRAVGLIYLDNKNTIISRITRLAKSGHELMALSISYLNDECIFYELEEVFTHDVELLKVFRDYRAIYSKIQSPICKPSVEEAESACRTLRPEGLDLSFADRDGNVMAQIPIVNVMLAEWDGPVARRISIGWVFLTKWVKAKREFRTVYLA